MSASRPVSINKPSSLLKPFENEEIFNLLGPRCTTRATSVAQLVLYTWLPGEIRREKEVKGVICFVKDYQKRSYFLRMYSLEFKSLVWEQEVYRHFKYSTTQPDFHTFATDTGDAGLHFESVEEAQIFITEIENNLKKRNQRRQASFGNVSNSLSSMTQRGSEGRKEIESTSNNKKVAKRKITKNDIGRPQNFQIISHIGWDPNDGFILRTSNTSNDLWNGLLGLAGEQMRKEETMDLTDDIKQRGGTLEKASSAPAPSTQALSRGQSRGHRPPHRPSHFPPPPPPPPPRKVGFSRPSPPPSHSGPPPPPPSGRGFPLRHPPPARCPPSTAPPPPPPTGQVPPPHPPHAFSSGGDEALLDPINQGPTSKKLSEEDHPSSNSKPTSNGGGAFQLALGQREKAIHSSVPVEIVARGHLAVESYNKALLDGKTCVKRVPVMLIGQDRTGKTSLKRSLKGENFNSEEDSTDGIDVDPSYFKVSTEIWKTGEKNEENDSDSATSFECRAAAQLIFKRLTEKENSSNAAKSSVVGHDFPIKDLEEPSPSISKSSFTDHKRTSELPEEPEKRGSESSTIHHRLTNELSEKPITNGTHSTPKLTTRNTESSFHFDQEELHEQESYKHLIVPELPEDIATMVEKLLQDDDKSQDEEAIYSVLWDFGGQSVFYSTHPIFLTEKAIFILVCDLSRNPYERAEPPVRKGMYKTNVDISYNKTHVDYLDFWMSSIYSLVSPDDVCQQASLPETSPTLPPVFLVCTHADKPFGGASAGDLALEIYGFLKTKIYEKHLFKDVFVVDNTKSGSKQECREVVRLREEILSVAKELLQMEKAIPLRWLKYENALQKISKEGYKWLPLDEARRIASEVCKIDDDKEFSTLLHFLHDQRILIHFTGSPELEKMVILDPQWLIDVFKKVITFPRDNHVEERVRVWWRKLEKTGILDENLLNHSWSPLFDNKETYKSLIAIMERLSLLCSWPSSEDNKQYLVPSMLLSPPTKDVITFLGSVRTPSLFVKFSSGRVPPGLFSRFILLFFQWCSEKWESNVKPQLFHDFAMFHILPNEGTSVTFMCHSGSIEIIVHSESGDLETTPYFTHSNCDVSTCGAIHWQLILMLECMRKEFCWLKNMDYEMCVCCPVCSKPGSATCRAHDVRGCECLHLLSKSDLSKSQYCTQPGIRGSCRIRIGQFTMWFSFEDEKGKRILLSQKEAPNEQGVDKSLKNSTKETEEKALALPDGVMKSIQSQASDPNDIVTQFKETLQLDKVSLKNPKPETKQLIRHLAVKAKSENRTDVVQHLRGIVPAGTTGPLLNEDLDVRLIPFSQKKNLTFSLSGGDEWKLLAEKLGMSQIDIRFIDKRVVNPCDVVLSLMGNNRYLSVGEVYDILVDCDLAGAADIM